MTQAFNLSQFANKVNTSGQASLTTAVTGTLPIANGGTNLTALGTANQILGVNAGATALEYKTAAASGFSNMTVFTSPGTFTTPASTTQIKVTVVGGGGNGGSTPSGGGGGGGGAIFVGPVAASSPFAVTVGGAGGTSSFAALASATGGATGGAPGAGAAGGAGTAGTLQLQGAPGGPGPSGRAGGSSFLGGGSQLSGGNGGNSGGGAGGNGAPGAGGVVIVEF
jgi:hypothetical protein